MKEKSKAGRPKKPTTFKPSLRCPVKKWEELQEKYPRQLNKMFNDWLNTI